MARVSYVTVKENYLEQSTEHVKTLCSYMASSLDRNYLEFISINGGQAKEDYVAFLKEHVTRSGVENAFIFNKNLQLLAFTKDGVSATQLQLNRNEILNIGPGSTEASFPGSSQGDPESVRSPGRSTPLNPDNAAGSGRSDRV